MADLASAVKRKLKSLYSEFATRKRRGESYDFFGLLPDPDPVLTKAGLDAVVLESLLADPHVFACYQSRKAGVLTREWQVQFPEGTQHLQDEVNDWMSNLDNESITSWALDAIFFGYSPLEIMWERGVNGRIIPGRIEQRPFEWFRFNDRAEPVFISRYSPRGEPLPPFKFIIVRHFASYKNPYGVRLLSRVFWPVSFKKGSFRFWMMFLEKFGVPWLIGKVPAGANDETRQELLTMLESMLQDAVAVVNDDQSVENLNIWNKGATTDTFSTLVNVANGEISKAILTQTLTTEVGDKGAYAASQSHLQVREEVCQMDRKVVINCYNQLFKYYTILNYGRMSAYPYIRFIEEEDANEEISRRDVNLFNQGVRYRKNYYQRIYKIREDEFDIVETPGPWGAGQTQPRRDENDER